MIDTDHALRTVLPRLRRAPWMALDTEADSLHAYPEKLCLIQVSIPGDDLLFDPLSGMSVQPLLDVLGSHELILHGADYDLRLLYRGYQFSPKAVFDTMLAAQLLGHAELGLEALTRNLLGLKLEKGPQRANWAQRPLTERMTNYARNDTRHLKPIADRLQTELDKKHRRAWHREACARRIAECARERIPDPNQVWRVKGAARLDRKGLAVLRALWHWREAEATRANRPPYFVLAHETLVALAAAAADGNPLEPHLPRRASPRRLSQIRRAVDDALALPAEDRPKPARRHTRSLTLAERRRHDALRRKRDAQATALGIDPSLIASRADLIGLVADRDAQLANMMSWQRDLMFG